ncbi:MAG: ZrgA family zinc uptake protein [Burkholderiaceae bacterium]
MAKQESEHQDVVVEWSIRCEQPSQLKRASFQGFDRYKRLRRVDVQYNLPSGMGKARLTSRQRDLQLP